ncbi:MAG: hypothetical protein CM1200mP3_04730 [Chloroflexota bacterium]|nr:MAG: hypothetical protein CM1200mP3_04730 [Chloroflexota bacterium]
MQEMSSWEKYHKNRRGKKTIRSRIGTNATFGSNFVGDFSVDLIMRFMEHQYQLWESVSIPVTSIAVGDPMGWCHPKKVEEIFKRVKEQWPSVNTFRAHFHNSRGMAIPSIYAAINSLDQNDTIYLDGSVGGFGGCPYCGNGRATGMALQKIPCICWKGWEFRRVLIWTS